MKIKAFILLMLVLPFLDTRANTENDSPFEVSKLSESVYILTYSWSEGERVNIGVVVDDSGVVLINTLMSEQAPLVEAEVLRISNRPIKYVINSNWDNYNIEGNEYFHKRGATIIAHKNLGYNANAFTNLLFDDRMTLKLSNDTITAYRSYGHSFGHINIHVKSANVIFAADSYRNQWMTIEGPLGLDGFNRGLDSILAMADESTLIVPGNTSSKLISGVEDVKFEKQHREAFANHVLALYQKGKTRKEIVVDSTTKKFFEHYELYQHITVDEWAINPIIFFYHVKSKPGAFERYTGNYVSSDGRDVQVFVEDGRLFAKSYGWFYVPLALFEENKFWIDPQHHVSYIEFTSSVEGEYQEMTLRWSPEENIMLSRSH